MTELQKCHIDGKTAELAAITYFLEQGYKVYTPVIDNGCDLIAEKNGVFIKAQIKHCYAIMGYAKRTNSKGIKVEYQSSKVYQARRIDKNSVDFIYINTPIGVYLIPSKEVRTTTLSIQCNGKGRYEQYKIN